MTLLAFNLRPPDVPAVGGSADLMDALLAMWPLLRTYVLSFVVIAIYWLSHHFQFQFIRHTDRTLLWINIFFLMFVAIIPFSTAVLGRYGQYQASIALYSTNLTLVGLANAIQWAYATYGRRLVGPDLPDRVVHLTMARILLAPVVAVLCFGISYIKVEWAVNFYYTIVIAYVLLARRPNSLRQGDTI
jgi:uncharacterized membrane protein